jgi:hypothetical protein
MDILTRLFDYIISVAGVIAWLLFVVGFFTGVLLSWLFRSKAAKVGATVLSWPFRRKTDNDGAGVLFFWPFKRKADKDFDESILDLKKEVENVEAELDQLWSMTFGPNYPRPLANQITAEGADKKTEANTNLKNTKKMVESFAGHLRSIAHTLKPRLKPNTDTPFPNQDAHFQEPHSVPIDQPTITRRGREEEYELPGERAKPGRPIRTFKTTKDNPLNEMVQLYNLAVNDTVAREQFREQFCPVRIGTVNAVERRQNPTIKADIRETTDGEFFALPISGTNEFAVFPRLGLTIEAVSFSAGAVGEVFEKTQEHNPKLFYSHYAVKQPAIFRLEGGHWNLREPGELKLGYGDT